MPARERKNDNRVSLGGRLFWFLKKGAALDLSEPSSQDLYVQQVVSHGTAGDVKLLLRRLDMGRLKESLERLKRFLPTEVRMFWEDFLAGHQ